MALVPMLFEGHTGVQPEGSSGTGSGIASGSVNSKAIAVRVGQTPLEHRFHAPGIGLVLETKPGSTERLELVSFTPGS